MKRKLNWDEVIGILFFLISVGMLSFSVYFCFSSDIWYDELFTMGLAGQSCGELVSMTARDVHPPLYYLIVKLFLTGTAEGGLLLQVTLAKLSSCFPFFLCMFFSMFKIRKNFGLLTAGLFSFLLIAMPQMANYTVEVRMYGYALLFVTVETVLSHELVKKSRAANWFLLTACALAACYTHYFACVASCMVYLYLLIAICRQKKVKQMIKPYLFSGLLCVLLYLPWLLMVVTRQVGQVKENYWIQPVSLRTLPGCAKFIFKPSFSDERINVILAVIFSGVYAAVAAVGVLQLVKQRREKTVDQEKENRIWFAAGCVFVFLGLVLFGILASLMIRPVFVYRYMLPVMGVFWLAFAVLMGSLKSKKAVLVPLLIFLSVIGIRNFRAFYGEEMWKRLQMENALLTLEQIDGDDIIICNFDQVQGVLSYYLDNETYLWYGNTEELIREMYPENSSLVEGEFTDEAGIARIKELSEEGKTLWFAGSGNARDEIIDKWNAQGISAEKKGEAMIERYWFNIYKLEVEEH